MLAYICAIFVVLFAYSQGQVFHFGRCPKVTTVKSLDINKYLGVWYEIQKFPAIFEANQRCVTANYTLKDDGHINVDNIGYNGASKKEAIGDAYVPDPNEPGKLLVKFANAAPYGDYNVLDTDYNTYSLVYSCGDFLRLARVEFAWILARQRTISNDLLQKLRQKYIDFQIDVGSFVVEDQSNCP